MKAGHRDVRLLTGTFPRIDTIPFESDYKFMGSLHDLRGPGGAPRRVLLVKGAPDRLIPRCAWEAGPEGAWGPAPIDREAWLASNAAFATPMTL